MKRLTTRVEEIERAVDVDTGPPLPMILKQGADGVIRDVHGEEFVFTEEIRARYAAQGLMPIVLRRLPDGDHPGSRGEPGIA